MISAKLTISLASLVALGLSIAVILQQQSLTALRSELTSLRKQLSDARAAAAASGSAGSRAANELAVLRAEHAELVRLRIEIARLRQAESAAAKTRPAGPRKLVQENQPEPVDAELEAYNAQRVARLNAGKTWGQALLGYAEENDGLVPESLDQAASFLPENLADRMGSFAADKYEMLYQGSLRDLSAPAQTLVLREKEAMPNFREPGFARTYVFADGHSEVHSSPDGKFEEWEKARLAVAGTR